MKELAKRCRAGDVGAWQECYDLCHPDLIRHLQFILQTKGDIVDEMAQEVWCEIIANDGIILDKYDPSVGSLSTFIRGIAKNKVRAYLKKESRRRVRELATSRSAVCHSPDNDLDDFLHTLTPAELNHANNLMNNNELENTNYIRQLSYRIRQKLKKFFG